VRGSMTLCNARRAGVATTSLVERPLAPRRAYRPAAGERRAARAGHDLATGPRAPHFAPKPSQAHVPSAWGISS